MYNSKIFEIFKNPANAGGLQGSNGIGKYIDETCGDFVKIYLKINENQKITEARFKTMGCVGAIVASSVLCDIITGLTITQAQAVSAKDILAVTGEYPLDKMYSLDFVFRSLNLAIADYYDKLEKDDKKPKKTKKELKATQEQPQENEFESVEDEYTNELKVYMPEEKPTSEQLSAFDNNENINPDYFNDDELFESMIQEQNTPPQKPKIKKAFLQEQDFEQGSAFDTVANSEQEITDHKATKMVEDAKTFSPVVETKILTDEEMEKLNLKNKNNKKEEKQSKKSRAKAIFDSMFED